MKRFLLLALCVMLALGLSSCVYSSVNLMSAQGKDILVVGMEGIIHVQDASLRVYRSMDGRSHKTDKPDFAARPNFVENSDAANVSIGKATKAQALNTVTSTGVTTPMVSATTTTTNATPTPAVTPATGT